MTGHGASWGRGTASAPTSVQCPSPPYAGCPCNCRGQAHTQIHQCSGPPYAACWNMRHKQPVSEASTYSHICNYTVPCKLLPACATRVTKGPMWLQDGCTTPEHGVTELQASRVSGLQRHTHRSAIHRARSPEPLTGFQRRSIRCSGPRNPDKPWALTGGKGAAPVQQSNAVQQRNARPIL